MSVHYKKIFY